MCLYHVSFSHMCNVQNDMYAWVLYFIHITYIYVTYEMFVPLWKHKFKCESDVFIYDCIIQIFHMWCERAPNVY